MVFVPDNYALSLNKSCLLYLLLKRVRSILLSGRPSSYILLTASSTTAENYNLATEAGIDDFLSKPVHRVREAEKTVYIILLTARGSKENIIEGLRVPTTIW